MVDLGLEEIDENGVSNIERDSPRFSFGVPVGKEKITDSQAKSAGQTFSIHDCISLIFLLVCNTKTASKLCQEVSVGVSLKGALIAPTVPTMRQWRQQCANSAPTTALCWRSFGVVGAFKSETRSVVNLFFMFSALAHNSHTFIRSSRNRFSFLRIRLSARRSC